MLDLWCGAQTNLQTWSADLTQTKALKVLSRPLVSKGRVWMAVPDRFRWELGDPPQTVAVRQPDQLVLIYPLLKRAEKYPLGEAQPGPWKDMLALLDASFPRSRAELEKHFQVMGMTQTNSVVSLALQPRSVLARKFMSEIQVCFRTNDYLPVATELKFSDGSSMRNDFTNSVLNGPVEEERFKASLPPDFSVVEPLRR
jgi:outer membrane lipoprotein-sorting protein